MDVADTCDPILLTINKLCNPFIFKTLLLFRYLCNKKAE